MKKLNWYNLHGEGWGNSLTHDSYTHPAKVRPGLARKIYEYAIEQEYIKRGSIVVDPFAGIGGFALHAMQNGLHWIGVELEEKFVGLGQQNITMWNKRFSRLPHWGTAVLLQGDSRRLCGVVREAGVVVSSPPFTGVTATQDPNFLTTGEQRKLNPSKSNLADYGTAIGQLAAMPPGNHAAIVSSPPYAKSTICGGTEFATVPLGTRWATTGKSVRKDESGYGDSEGQLAAMREGELSAVVSSPPYAGGCAHTGGDDPQPEHIRGGELRFVDYGESNGQLANLPVGDAIVGSPPYEGTNLGSELTQEQFEKKMERWAQVSSWRRPRPTGNLANPNEYGDTDGQPGTETGETFWTAAHTIMQQCHAILKPGGVAVWVCKRFVRKKRIVEFSQQWAQLGEACGFETVEWARAWLVEDRGAQFTLFGGLDKRTVERKSFFRRLYENKYPGNSIDWEDVIIQRKL